MTDESIIPVEEVIPDEPIVPKRDEPEGCGFSKQTKAAFKDYNSKAAYDLRNKTGDKTIKDYTYALPDTVDSNSCWVREESIYTKDLPSAKLDTIKVLKEATTIKLPQSEDVVK